MSSTLRKRVFVGLSGGVDSSVSAALLKQAGYDVTGVFIKVWQPDFFECTAKEDRLDAMRVCAKLKIPFIELDLEKEYKKEVVDYMIREYKAGKTPNPDVMCNRFIKFGGFYNWAMKKGADFVATGHYARVEATREFPISNFQFPNKSQPSRLKAMSYKLYAGTDPNKDQSYFLWQIRKEQLPHILFPIGGLHKPKVRSLAKKFGLVTANKKDSQGLCFIGKVDMKDFLLHYITEKKGKVYDERGLVLGEHSGAFFYTVGERVGSLNYTKGREQKPHYVIQKNMRRNSITVSSKFDQTHLFGERREVQIANCNWFCDLRDKEIYSVRTRYRQVLERVRVVAKGTKALVRFDVPQTVAPGQSLVVYQGEVCVGGGIIT